MHNEYALAANRCWLRHEEKGKHVSEGDLSRTYTVPFKHGTYTFRIRLLGVNQSDELERVLDAIGDAVNNKLAGNATRISSLIEALEQTPQIDPEFTGAVHGTQDFNVSVWDTIAELELTLDAEAEEPISADPILAYLAAEAVPAFLEKFGSCIAVMYERKAYEEAGFGLPTSLGELLGSIGAFVSRN